MCLSVGHDNEPYNKKLSYRRGTARRAVLVKTVLNVRPVHLLVSSEPKRNGATEVRLARDPAQQEADQPASDPRTAAGERDDRVRRVRVARLHFKIMTTL